MGFDFVDVGVPGAVNSELVMTTVPVPLDVSAVLRVRLPDPRITPVPTNKGGKLVRVVYVRLKVAGMESVARSEVEGLTVVVRLIVDVFSTIWTVVDLCGSSMLDFSPYKIPWIERLTCCQLQLLRYRQEYSVQVLVLRRMEASLGRKKSASRDDKTKFEASSLTRWG